MSEAQGTESFVRLRACPELAEGMSGELNSEKGETDGPPSPFCCIGFGPSRSPRPRAP
jgi:hypothetical protein